MSVIEVVFGSLFAELASYLLDPAFLLEADLLLYYFLGLLYDELLPSDLGLILCIIGSFIETNMSGISNGSSKLLRENLTKDSWVALVTINFLALPS